MLTFIINFAKWLNGEKSLFIVLGQLHIHTQQNPNCIQNGSDFNARGKCVKLSQKLGCKLLYFLDLDTCDTYSTNNNEMDILINQNLKNNVS